MYGFSFSFGVYLIILTQIVLGRYVLFIFSQTMHFVIAFSSMPYQTIFEATLFIPFSERTGYVSVSEFVKNLYRWPSFFMSWHY